jgi:peptide/nickel transport system permease protein
VSFSPVDDVQSVDVYDDAASDISAEVVGRSPWQIARRRLRRDRVGVISGIALLMLAVLALAAPLIAAGYGIGPQQQFQDQLNAYGNPLGYLGGMSGQHWFGLEPGLGRDIFIRLLYGIRTSLFIAFAAAVVTTAIGVALGIVAGYLGGWADAVISWITDFALALPFLVFALAVIPTIRLRFFGPRDAVPTWFDVLVIIGIFAVFGWTGTARLVRGQVISLREREFIDAARAMGSSTRRILWREILPNVWAPILVTFSLQIPQYITGEAALSFLGVGIVEPTPDLGRMIYLGLNDINIDFPYFFIPGFTLFILVLAFNLFGDAVRDALDPRSAGR